MSISFESADLEESKVICYELTLPFQEAGLMIIYYISIYARWHSWCSTLLL